MTSKLEALEKLKGGYQPQSRLEGVLDEIGMEAKIASDEPSMDQMRRAFAEIGRLTREAQRFAKYITNTSRLGGMASA